MMYHTLIVVFVMALVGMANAEVAKETHYLREVVESSPVQAACSVTVYVLALQKLCGYETIHGLWPDPSPPCDTCTTEVFSTSKLSSSTLADMKKYWPTCQSGTTNESFWSHEWSKHGTCSGMSQDAYFSKAISLFKTYGSKCSSDCHICFNPSLSYIGVGNC